MSGFPNPRLSFAITLPDARFDVLSELSNFVVSHPTPGTPVDWSPYISFALSSGGPPDFKPNFTGRGRAARSVSTGRVSGIADPVLPGSGLQRSLAKAAARHISVKSTRYHEPVTRALLEANAYLRNPTSGYMGRRFFVFVEMLAPAESGPYPQLQRRLLHRRHARSAAAGRASSPRLSALPVGPADNEIL